jgi:hypothetical protein
MVRNRRSVTLVELVLVMLLGSPWCRRRYTLPRSPRSSGSQRRYCYTEQSQYGLLLATNYGWGS